MAATQIKEMRHPHDAVLDFILAHPFATLRDISNATTYSIPWLSQMIRSDIFQAEYQKRRGEIESAVMQPIQQRLEAVAHLAIDALEEKLKVNNDPEFALDAFDKILHRAGYAPSKVVNPLAMPQINNNVTFVVQRDELEQLRGQIVQGSVADKAEFSPGEKEAAPALPPPPLQADFALERPGLIDLSDLLSVDTHEPE